MLKAERGILIAVDHRQEWMLPWWWGHYSAHNAYPLFIVDFGMTEEGLAWCRERGDSAVLGIPDALKTERGRIAPEIYKSWAHYYGGDVEKTLSARDAIFRKPLALELSPFEETLWLDLDCEVRGDLTELFAFCDVPAGIALAPEHLFVEELQVLHNMLAPNQTYYNTGVIVYKKNSPIIAKWSQEVLERSYHYPTDQHALAHVLYTEKLPCGVLKPRHNYLKPWHNPYPDALINHWILPEGKAHIRKQMEMRKGDG